MKLLTAGAVASAGAKSVAQASAQATCAPSLSASQTTEECCRGACVNNLCDSTCSQIDAICEQTLDCCSDLACVNADGTPRCRPNACASEGDSCRNDGACCRGICRASVCAAPAATEEPTQTAGADSGGSAGGGSRCVPAQTTVGCGTRMNERRGASSAPRAPVRDNLRFPVS